MCPSHHVQEEQKVIEAKIRMRQQELQDDEEREQRREEDIRAGRIGVQAPRAQAIANHQIASAPIDEIDGLNWQYRDRQSQVKYSHGIAKSLIKMAVVLLIRNHV